jgi:hypothetical protein
VKNMVIVRAYRRKGKRRVVAVRRHNRGKGNQAVVFREKPYYFKQHAVLIQDKDGTWSVKIGRRMLPDGCDTEDEAKIYAETYDSA